jgi:hypothetical protein
MRKMKAVSKALICLLGRAGGRLSAVAAAASLPLMMVSMPAHAFKLSKLFSGMKTEMATIVPVVLLGIMGIGVIIGGWAIISGTLAKKNQEPLKWQVAGVIGGAMAIIFPLILLAFAGSMSNEQGDAEGVMSELNINY